MRRFTRLFQELDQTTRTGEKTDALASYFREAPPEDAVWTLALLSGRRPKRVVTSRQLSDWTAQETNLPHWMLGECYDAVGDGAEMIALLLDTCAPPVDAPREPPPLHEIMARLASLRLLDESDRRAAIVEMWRSLDTPQTLVFNKLITGEFRVGASAALAARGVARAFDLPEPLVAHRVAGRWEPTPEAFARITSADATHDDHARPFPFFLASQLDDPASPDELDAVLGPREEWLAEWKWDGVRAQLIRRSAETLVWSRGDELVTDAYPELRAAAESLPEGTVLDGEILAFEAGRPLPFSLLQRRLGRKRVQASLFPDVPIVFMAYDILESRGEDLRDRPLAQRRQTLVALLRECCARADAIRLSPIIEAPSWDALATLRAQSRDRQVEGIMLKRLGSPYRVGRKRGDWWKWKIDPFTLDVVMLYAQRGHGRRASLFTDYTFGVWAGDTSGEGELTPIAKAYSGLTDEEIRRVDAWVQRHTIDRHGPLRVVEPAQVFELAFDGIQPSDRHKSGIALRFPRMHRWRHDKKPDEANTLHDAMQLLKQQQRAGLPVDNASP